MSLTIQNNIAAMDVHRNLQVADNALSKSLQRLSSGYRINSAADDAAGLSISESMSATIASLTVAQQNTSQATSLLQVADGAMTQTANMLDRLKELATQAASANVSDTDRAKINSEANTLVNEIDRIANSTTYDGTKLLDGSYGVGISAGTTITATAGGLSGAAGMKAGDTYTVTVTAGTTAGTVEVVLNVTGTGSASSQTVDNISVPTGSNTTSVNFNAFGVTLTFNDNVAASSTTWALDATATGNSTFQVGSDNNANNRITVSIGSATSTDLGLSQDMMSTASAAQTALTTIDTAISNLADTQGNVGAAENRLGYANANLATSVENQQSAESVIKDADMASEMTNFTKNQILVQAGTAMLAQANLSSQYLLTLFR